MGLTIHYRLRAQAQSPQQARELLSRLRQRALDLPFSRVGELVEFTGKDCDFNQHDRNSASHWLLIQAREYVEEPAEEAGHYYHYDVIPTHVIAFDTAPGDGCEPANFGLCQFPESILVTRNPQAKRRRKLATGLGGWCWGSFCKTQYASDPQAGGTANFLRCHVAVIRLLDHARELGILEDVSDEGHYWERRDIKALAQTVGEWNELLAAFVGELKDHLGAPLVAPITEFPDFEHLEAAGRTRAAKSE